jgi:hypothetical protein
MTPAQLEHRVLQIVDAVKARQVPEDSRVELKAQWPVAGEYKTARKLAGHANAARGAPILWIIGVDERGGSVTGAPENELANWWPAVQKHFNGVPPMLLYNISVPVDGNNVVALLFDTSRAPFVVTVPGGGAVDREVPWREGNQTRSAKREDLIRVLVPVQILPDVEMLQGALFLFENDGRRSTAGIATWRLELVFYLMPPSRDVLYFPFHRCSTSFRLRSSDQRFDLKDRVELCSVGKEGLSSNIAVTTSDLVVSGPGLARLVAETKTQANLFGYGLEFEFSLSMETSRGESMALGGRLLPSRLGPNEGGAAAVWKIEDTRDFALANRT